jgi:myo-inositol 2-dehydrogenase/D-chiro-inositol 1-dehydrogenase
MRPIGMALIGGGTIGRIHAQCIARNKMASLRWVVSRGSTGSVALASEYGARHATSLDAVLADPAVEAVIIASPTDVHETHLLASIGAGKAVLCEKPLADNLERALACCRAAQGAGAVVAVGFNRRFDTAHAAIHRRRSSGEIGAVRMLHLVSRSSRSAEPDAAARAGGMLRDKGTHFFDLACWLANAEPVEVYAAGDCLVDHGYAEYGDVDTAVLTLRFHTGALATFSFSRHTAYGHDELIEVVGSEGMLESQRQQVATVSLYRDGQIVKDGLHAGWYHRFAPTYEAQLDAFLAAVDRSHLTQAGLIDGLRAQAVAEAAVVSLAERRPVSIDNIWREI